MLRPRKLPPNPTDAQVAEYCQAMNRSWINWRVLRWVRHWRCLLCPPTWTHGRRYFSQRWYAPDRQ
jgi:hypothetical protein